MQHPTTAAADAQGADVIVGLSPKDHPYLAALSGEMLGGTATTRLTWSFEVVLNGLAFNALRAVATRKKKGMRIS